MKYTELVFQPLILHIVASKKDTGSRPAGAAAYRLCSPCDRYPNVVEQENLKNCKVIARNYSFRSFKLHHSTCQFYITQRLPML
jgi:hypothetical protein